MQDICYTIRCLKCHKMTYFHCCSWIHFTGHTPFWCYFFFFFLMHDFHAVEPQYGKNRLEKRNRWQLSSKFLLWPLCLKVFKVANVAFGFHNMAISCILSDICTSFNPLGFVSVGYTQLVKLCVTFGNLRFDFLWFSEINLPWFS